MAKRYDVAQKGGNCFDCDDLNGKFMGILKKRRDVEIQRRQSDGLISCLRSCVRIKSKSRHSKLQKPENMKP
jgi:hypothetical protein